MHHQTLALGNLQETIEGHLALSRGEHDRFRSWEHCYRYFRTVGREGAVRDRDQAALQLAFYLASWGMYRGSSFLLQYTYTVHRGAIDALCENRFNVLWTMDFGARPSDGDQSALLLELVANIREAYVPFAKPYKKRVTETLITKVLLGVVGCLPACDRYFIDGFNRAEYRYSKLDASFVGLLLNICQANLPVLQAQQSTIGQRGGVRYPLMKLLDMYFWQIGSKNSAAAVQPPPIGERMKDDGHGE